MKRVRTEKPSVNNRSSFSVFEIKQGTRCVNWEKGEEVSERVSEGRG